MVDHAECIYMNRGDGTARYVDGATGAEIEIRHGNVHNDAQVVSTYLRMVLACASFSHLSFEQMVLLFAHEAMNIGTQNKHDLYTLDDPLNGDKSDDNDDSAANTPRV